MKIVLPDKKFYSFLDLSKRWGCEEKEIDHLVYEQQHLRVAVRVGEILLIKFPYLKLPQYNKHSYNDQYMQEIRLQSNGELVYQTPTLSPFKSKLSSNDFVYVDLHYDEAIHKIGLDLFKIYLPSKLKHDHIYFKFESPRFTGKLQMFTGEPLNLLVLPLNNLETSVTNIPAIAIFDNKDVCIPLEEIIRFEKKHLNKISPQTDSPSSNSIRHIFQLPQKPDEAARHICEMGNKYIQQHSKTPIETELREYIISENNKWLEPNMDSGGILTIGDQRVTKRGFKDRYRRYLTDIDES